MASITIRDIPEETVDRLTAQAARGGLSLQDYLRHELISLALHDDVAERAAAAEWVREVREFKERTGISVSAEDILRWRDADRPR